ncbi:MAG TPA: leucine-rich repeat domain-containing protein [Verrucomicrobiota bacterium]|nr:leucine-rich repeat domain-containing protein [Verrucomicrobiota bacterium]
MKLFRNLRAREAPAHTVPKPVCQCLEPQYGEIPWTELQIHTEKQDIECAGWQRLNELIDQAAGDGRAEFSPGPEMSPSEWAQITELPKTISKLKRVKHFILNGSSLVRIPPEIGEMAALEQFTPYTSYRLHWFPYEITRCTKLKHSTVSTRALYGNYKYRAPFPTLPQDHPGVPDRCSVCEGSFGAAPPLQYWVSLRVATDVLPLLVHACSEKCISNLPQTPENYVRFPHQGGLGLEQPKSE